MPSVCHPCAVQVAPQVPTKNHVPQRALTTAGRYSIKPKKKISKSPKIEAAATQPVTATSSRTPLGHNYTACKNLLDHLYKMQLARKILTVQKPSDLQNNVQQLAKKQKMCFRYHQLQQELNYYLQVLCGA